MFRYTQQGIKTYLLNSFSFQKSSGNHGIKKENHNKNSFYHDFLY